MTGSGQVLMLELRDVSLSFQSKMTSFDQGVHRVLDSVSLKLYKGESLGIIGKNGCGKTSILRLMAGILAPSQGTARRRPGASCALLSIGLGFKPELSGRDNALLAALLQGATLKAAKSYLDGIKAFSELGDSFEEPVKTYSAGMKSRLGFTTALLTDVDIMLIDEVLSVGDAHFKQKAEESLKERILSKQTVVFVSHSRSQIQSLCDRAIWLHEGRIAAEGVTDKVLSSYEEHIKSMRVKETRNYFSRENV
jgi:lipopolysaccharide transport system ATP-binding protein